MTSFFLNPWTMVAGATLVLAPIIIHLINRMRFRRIQWAAMEFLLKAQKKMRRRKILEQLLLLLLRMLLVFLIGVLFARFLGFDQFIKGKETRPTVHVIILDDTPSMADVGQVGQKDGQGDAFAEAKRQITERILPSVTQATTIQRLRILRLSDQSDLVNLDTDKEPEQVNAALIDQVKTTLSGVKPSAIRVSLVKGLQKAQALFEKAPPDTAKIVHVVSDLRGVDWTEDGEAIAQAVHELTQTNGVKVHIIDVASPYRKADRKTPAFSDNVGIVELKPKSRVVAAGRDVEFEIRIKNFGTTGLSDVRVNFYLNGLRDVIQTIGIPSLPANQEHTEIFSWRSVATGTKEDPLARFNLVTAVLDNVGTDALAADNVRHTVVEVREKLNVLLVVNADDKPEDDNGDSYNLNGLLSGESTGIDVTRGGVALLEQDLRRYSAIYLLNVPQLSDPQVANLERYVREGGGVGVFLGPKVQPEQYNERMYRDTRGFFPVPLPTTGPSEPLTEEAKKKRNNTFAKRLLLRDPAMKTHPAVARIYPPQRGGIAKENEVEKFFAFAYIDQHWPVARLGKWREDRSVQEIYCLPNELPMRRFEQKVFDLIGIVKEAYKEPKFAKDREILDPLLDKIRATSNSTLPLTELVRNLDELLADQVNAGGANEPLLREFWNQTELVEAKKLAQTLRDSCKFGDPLYLAKQFGHGRVTVMTIPVASPWSDWPTDTKGAPGWIAVVEEMRRYLCGGGPDQNLSVGSPLIVPLEAGRYKPTASWVFLSTETPKPGEAAPQKLAVIREPELGKTEPGKEPVISTALESKDGALRLNFNEAKRPGAYLFTLNKLTRETDAKETPSRKEDQEEYLAEAFNIDAMREGDLQRTNTDEFKTAAKGAEVHSAEDTDWLDTLKQKQTDLSSGRWIYLVIMLVLIFEQAMAVRLSYHTRPEDLGALAPSMRAVFAHGTAPPVSGEGAEPAAEASGAV